MTTFFTAMAVLIGCLLALPASAGSVNVKSLKWTSMSNWLGNPTESATAKATAEGVRFAVEPAGKGMKWTAPLSPTVDFAKTPWVLIRYRAERVGALDYVVSIGSDKGGGDFQTVMSPAEFIGDGQWHTLVVQLKQGKGALTAVHVQAASQSAWLEISRLEFSPERPKLAVSDFLEIGIKGPGSFSTIDISRICASSPEQAISALNLKGWLPESEAAVFGVPFKVTKSVAVTESDTPLELEIPAGGIKASEVFFLMAAAPVPGAKPAILVEPQLFSVKVEYESGPADTCVPARLPSKFGLAEGLGVYAVPVDSTRPLKGVTIRDNTKGIVLSFVAATAGIDTNLAAYARPAPVSGVKLYRPALKSGSKWTLKAAQNEASLTDGRSRVVLRMNPDIEIAISDGTGIESKGSLWSVTIGGKSLSSIDFAGELVVSGQDSAEFTFVDKRGMNIKGALKVSVSETGPEMKLRLQPTTSGAMSVAFPTLENLKHADGKNLAYCFPKRASILNDTNLELRESYSGAFPLQFIDVYGPDGGVYLLTKDTGSIWRQYYLTKNADGVSMRVEYPEKDYSGGFESVSSAIGFHSGDWHAAFDTYRSWLKSWYKPAAPRKEWFTRVFNLRQQFLRFYSITDGNYYDQKTQKFTFEKGLALDKQYFGGIDYLHIFDWGMSHEHGLGDYSPWGDDFKLEEFRESIRKTRESGIPVGLYLEGYLASLNSKIGQAHGEEWEIIKADGQPVRAYSIYTMCPALTGWQDYLASTYARTKEETGADGFYIDEYGYGFTAFNCHARDHGHEVPRIPLLGEGEVMKKVRAALGPDKALYTEYPPTDVQSQLLDGAFEKAVCFGSDELSPSRINLTRFAIPDFKFFEIVMLDAPLGDKAVDVGLVFFNGEGMWIEGPADTWYTEEARALIRNMYRVVSTHRDCFTTMNPVPLIPTGQERVYANQFPGNKRTAWTLYNANFASVSGEFLAIRHFDGARYYDAWNDKELSPRIKDGVAYIDLELGPKAVGCVVQQL